MPRNTCQYIIPGTKFYRLGSRSVLDQYGTNLQNIEKKLRRLYIADAGKLFNQADQSGAEALIVAYLCRAGRFRDLFLNGIKPHVFVALHLFADIWKEKSKGYGLDFKPDIDDLCNTPIPELKTKPFWKELNELIKASDNWTASERYYYIAKQVCHSSNYGIKAGMFCLNTLEKSKGKIVLHKEDADKFLGIYHSLFPEIREWHQVVIDQVRATGMLYNLLGYPITFTGDLNDENEHKEWFAAIAQSTVACITRKAYCDLQTFIETNKLEWDLLNDCHDSYLTQSPESESLECCKIMKSFIEIEMKSPRGETFRMKSELQSGKNWAPKSEYNPDGLVEVKL